MGTGYLNGLKMIWLDRSQLVLSSDNSLNFLYCPFKNILLIFKIFKGTSLYIGSFCISFEFSNSGRILAVWDLFSYWLNLF